MVSIQERVIVARVRYIIFIDRDFTSSTQELPLFFLRHIQFFHILFGLYIPFFSSDFYYPFLIRLLFPFSIGTIFFIFFSILFYSIAVTFWISSKFYFLPILQGTAPTDQRSLVAKQISKGIGDKEHQLELCVDSLENASYVLWRHLDHFVNTPSTRQRVGNIFEFIFEFIFSSF